MALTKIGKEGITGISNASDATAITITSGENVGIGTTDPGTSKLYLQDNHTTDVTNAATMIANTVFSINGNASEGSDLLRVGPMSSAGAYFMEVSNSAGNAAYNLCLNPINGGKVLIGTTATLSFASGASIQVLSSGIAGAFKNTAAGSQTISVYNTGNSGTRYLMWFESNASKTHVGSITSNGSATAFNTSSDYRLKENVDYTWDATTRLKQLKPARFNFIADDTNTLVDGFIAHEVSSIVPEAITGTKDAMTTEVLYVEGDELPDGKSVGDVKEASVPDMQGIDQSKLVPLLVKTIQELEARLTAGGL